MRVGVDMQSLDEVREALAAHGDRYLRRVYRAQEVADAGRPGTPSFVASLAARFAAKEAVLKVLRDLDPRPGWPDIEVVTDEGGWPSIRLHGAALDLARSAGVHELEVSLSHSDGFAIAVVVAP